MKEETRKEVQFCYLTKEEMNDPSQVIRGFAEDLSLEDVRKLIVSMRDVCSTTENVPYDDPKAREDLFYMTDKMLRFFEASYAQLNKVNVVIQMGDAHVRKLTVLEKQIFKNVKGVPNAVPCLYLFGKWLATAGFLPGVEVTIISEQGRIFITKSREWAEITSSVRLRA